jgi:hypothetical protein
MTPTLLTKIVAGIAAVLLVLLGVQTCRLNDADAATAKTALAYQNERAAHDSTRAVLGRDLDKIREALHDTVNVYQRLATQETLKQSAVDKVLGQQSKAIADLAIAIKGLRTSGQTTPVTTDSADVRHAFFSKDSVPYHVRASVWLPKPPLAGNWNLDITLDHARVQPLIACGPATRGVREARVTLITDPWLTADVTSAKFDTEVCNPGLGKTARRLHLGVYAGYGGTLNAGSILLGPQIGAGGAYTIF